MSALEEYERNKRRQYTANYRKNNPHSVLRDKIQTRSRYRALAQLALLYPEVYEELREKEEAKAWREEAGRDHVR